MTLATRPTVDRSVGQATPTISVRPITIPVPSRGDDLQIRVTAPSSGDRLPVVVFSHGFGKSMDFYAPLTDFWAGHGFVVVQPTHLDSRTLALAPDDPRTPDIWRIRVDDLTACLDHLDLFESTVPGLSGRVDNSRIAVAGHSWGAQTASTLLGTRVLDATGTPGEDMTDRRVQAGVLLALAGDGDTLSPFAAEHFPFMRPDFSNLTSPALIIAGDHDDSPLSTRGPHWFTDGYTHSPGAHHLLTLFGGEHSLGGVAGYAVAETTDEDPARVALVRRISTAFLRTRLGVDPSSFEAAAEPVINGQLVGGALSSK